MFGGLIRLFAVALVTGVAVGAPMTALASGCNGAPSAVNVYKECLPSGGGGKPTGGSSQHSGGPATTPPHATLAGPAARAIRHAGRYRRALAGLLESGRHAALLGSGNSGGATAPSAVGSVLDLGSGPMALLIALAGTAALILGGSGVRVWRHRQRP